MFHRLHFLKMIEGIWTSKPKGWNEAVHLVVTEGAEFFLCWFEEVAIVVRLLSLIHI